MWECLLGVTAANQQMIDWSWLSCVTSELKLVYHLRVVVGQDRLLLSFTNSLSSLMNITPLTSSGFIMNPGISLPLFPSLYFSLSLSIFLFLLFEGEGWGDKWNEKEMRKGQGERRKKYGEWKSDRQKNAKKWTFTWPVKEKS